MEANEYYLNEYLKKEAESDLAQDWKDDYVEELLSYDGEYYPFKPENLQEAIAECKLHEAILFSSYVHVASVLPSETSNKQLAEYIIKFISEYWKAAAEMKADADYDTYYWDVKNGS